MWTMPSSAVTFHLASERRADDNFDGSGARLWRILADLSWCGSLVRERTTPNRCGQTKPNS